MPEALPVGGGGSAAGSPQEAGRAALARVAAAGGPARAPARGALRRGCSSSGKMRSLRARSCAHPQAAFALLILVPAISHERASLSQLQRGSYMSLHGCREACCKDAAWGEICAPSGADFLAACHTQRAARWRWGPSPTLCAQCAPSGRRHTCSMHMSEVIRTQARVYQLACAKAAALRVKPCCRTLCAICRASGPTSCQ